jgi:signal transduction histidine kinase
MDLPAFMPHGHCYLWSPTMITLQASSDFAIGCSYLFISAVLFRIFRTRKERFSGVVLSFGIFILACGATHFVEVWNIWHGDYWFSATVKIVTAIASIGTALYLIRLQSGIVGIPNRQQFEEASQERDAAKRENAAKDQFLAALSHELRTPLNPVLLIASDESQNPGNTEHARAQFAVIAKNVQVEAQLIDDLLDISRIAQGKLGLKMGRVEIRSVVQNAVNLVAPELAEKKVTLVTDIVPDDAAVSGDPIRIEQVLWNVLKNAVKFTPNGGSIKVRSRVEAQPMARVVIDIADTGLGMTPGEIKRVFDAFSQGDHANVPGHRFGGLGLGLAIARRLVELHGGTIKATSAGRDLGATFTIELPFESRAAPASSAPAVQRGAGPVFPGAISVLLVDDHEATLRALEQILKRRGYQVTTATRVSDAKDLAKEQSFDVLVSDVGIPGESGLELMTYLAKYYRMKGIALTGYGTEQDVHRSKEAGFAIHLTKPVSSASLTAAITALCEERLH